MAPITHIAPGPGPLPQVHDHSQAIVQASVTHQRPTHRSLGAMICMSVSLPNSYVKILTPRGLRPLGSPMRTPKDGTRFVHCTKAPSQGVEIQSILCSLSCGSKRKKLSAVFLRLGLPRGDLGSATKALAWFRSTRAPERVSTYSRFTELHHSPEGPPRWASSWPLIPAAPLLSTCRSSYQAGRPRVECPGD